MLYTLYDLNLAAWAPVRQFAKAGEALFSNPFLPFSYTPSGRAAAAVCELVERATRRYRKPAFGIDTVTIDGRELAVREEAVLSEPFCTLLHFRHEGAHDKPRLLVVAPLSGHYPTLLRGTVAALLPGHDVYITDWTDASQIPIGHGPFDLDDYIDLVIAYLEHLGPGTHVMAVCQPSVPVLAAASLMAAAAVAVAGIIGFVGLIVPHACRMIVGWDHRRLLPVAALGGASFLIAADVASRTLLAPQEIPVGVLTAMLGGPFFLYLLRTRRVDGGR